MKKKTCKTSIFTSCPRNPPISIVFVADCLGRRHGWHHRCLLRGESQGRHAADVWPRSQEGASGLGKCPGLGICFTSLKQVFVGNIPNSEKLGYPHHFQVFAGDIIVQFGY